MESTERKLIAVWISSSLIAGQYGIGLKLGFLETLKHPSSMKCIIFANIVLTTLGTNCKFNTLSNTADLLPLSNFVIYHCSIADIFVLHLTQSLLSSNPCWKLVIPSFHGMLTLHIFINLNN